MRTRFFQFNNIRHIFQPRKPRHPLVRVAAGIVGLGILALLVFLSVFVGAAMILAGVAWKLLSKSGTQTPADPTVVEGEYRVVSKPTLPLLR